ncbi:hypothetical protein [Antrihabitans stalactiti]|uniref:DUF4149 domain-containing protein n=1 Tax=Antrihabitans stalactiti TaxID=2584121 RepID=A0A848KU79_9NOCA|nr:hypothetical protein [Antrihabitans stalactiti]NMN99087.1 hypothetical protein [Antrihabitans stalactiti]
MTETARYLQLFAPMLWLGMVAAISFLEAPIKFRAPGITLALGLGIGRLVFRALNAAEAVLAGVLVICCLIVNSSATGWALLIAAVAALTIQIGVVRPPLSRRSDRILAGEDAPRSHLHLIYIGLEVVKVGLLVALALALTHPVLDRLA